MSSPRSPSSPDAAHERHDALLVAQLAARDELEPEQAREAAQLMATCPSCAQLAADLRAISRAVAWEPIPPRRRDFRIDPVRAEALRGSAWSRFLRRFAVPQGRSVRPIAAGVMSLGLVLVIAGNAWPSAAPSTQRGSSIQAPVTPAAAPDVGEQVAPAAVPPTELMVEEPAVVADTADDDETNASDLLAPDAGREAPAPQLYASSAKASAAPLRERDATSLERADTAAEDTAGSDTAAGAVGAAQEEAPRPEVTDAAGLELSEVASTERLDADAVAPPAGDVTTSDGPAGTPGSNVVPDRAAVTGSPDLATLVTWVGIGLAVIGALLLLLAWLSRRAADPLLH